MNRVAKGKRNEIKAIELLKSYGWLCERKNYNKWSSPDFYGLFDIVALKDNRVKWVQVKSNKNDVGKSVKKIKEWMIVNNIECDAEVWLKENYKGWKIVKINIDS